MGPNIFSFLKGRHSLFYLIVLTLMGGLMYLVVKEGQFLLAPNSDGGIITSLSHKKPTSYHPIETLLLQLALILIVARTLGWLSTRIGQPSVIGEIIAGILLGPSLLGIWFPEFSNFVFPKESLPPLQYISQIGLILFMFIIGMELDLGVLQKKAGDAIVISHASIVIPYALGMVLAFFIFEQYAAPQADFLSFALFMGIAMSITAFPVLAKILHERGMTRTRLGVIALACAAADDVTAWCILAAVIAIAQAGNALDALPTFLFAILYGIVMLKVLMPFLQKFGKVYVSRENMNKNVVALMFLLLLTSAWITELIGIHALFGAFLAGVIMPQNAEFKKVLTEKIEDLSMVVLLPVFFVITGLRTRLGLLSEPSDWIMTGWIIAIAVAGKLGGSMLAARVTRHSWHDSVAIGVLMNTRGLMELVVLNIGYDLGILTPQLFAMMVIMALVTTIMTGPALTLTQKLLPNTQDQPTFIQALYRRVLLSFAQPKTGASLLRVVDRLYPSPEVTSLHLTPHTELHPWDVEEFEKEGFKFIKQEARKRNILLKTLYRAASDVRQGILQEANSGAYDILLLGSARSVFSDNEVGGKVRQILDNCQCEVGVWVEKRFRTADQVLLWMNPKDQEILISHAQLLLGRPEATVTIILPTENGTDISQFKTLQDSFPNQIILLPQPPMNAAFLKKYDLLLIGLQGWLQVIEQGNNWLEYSPSTLILRGKSTINP